LAKLFRRQWHRITTSKSCKHLSQLSDAEKQQRRNYWLSDSLASFVACLSFRELPFASFLTRPVPTTLTILTNILFIYFLSLSFLIPISLMLSRSAKISDGMFCIADSLHKNIISQSLLPAVLLIIFSSLVGVLVLPSGRTIFIIFFIFFSLYIISEYIMLKLTKESIIKGLVLVAIVLLAISLYILVEFYLTNSGLISILSAIAIICLAFILLIVVYVLTYRVFKKKNKVD
jgi:hypothetical protein